MTRTERLALGGAMAVPWLFIWQGLDVTDQGYSLTNYRSFFRHPEATEDSASMWLTNLVGATWDAMFGWFGVVGMRALWALCLSLGMLLSFRLVRELTSTRIAALAVLIASLFLSDRRETWFSYNTSTSILLVAATLCLADGIARQRPRRLFAAGAFIGVLPFARFPNVLAVALLAALGLAAWIDAARRARLPRDVGMTVSGIAAGAGGTLAIIYLRGDAELVFGSVRDLFSPSSHEVGYGTDTLLDKFVSDQRRALAWGFGVCVAGAGLSRVLGKVPSSAAWVLVAGCAALGVFGLTRRDEPWRFVVTGTTCWVLAAVALGLWKRNFHLRVAAFIAFIVVVIAPLGSGNGIKNAHMGLWLALPLVLALLYTLDAPWLAGQGSKLALIAGIALGGEGLHRAATYTYRDAARDGLLTAVAHPQLRWQYTTPARAKVVTEVLDALEQRVAPGDYLLAFESTPLLHYLTNTRPYLNRPWLMGAESSQIIARLAADAPRRTGCLPVAVMSLKTTRSFEWPQRARRLEEKEPQRSTRLVLRAFLRTHRYKQTWENEFFRILEAPSAKGAACR